MHSLYEMFTSPALAMYWRTINENRSPMLGATLFPAKKKQGLKLKWIKGYKRLPIALMPSAFDAKPTLRDRLGVQDIATEMPFFREAMRIGEEDRQQLLMMLETGSQYVQNIISNIFDDVTSLVDGAIVQSERMCMQVIIDGKIAVSAPDDSGITVNYDYDYDPQGEWRSSNTQTLSSTTDKWTDHENSKPIQDILKIKRKMKGKGVAITRAVMRTEVWMHLIENKSIRMDMNVQNGNNLIVDDGMLQRYLLGKTGITFIVYDNMYQDSAGTDQYYYPDGYVTFLPNTVLGNTYYGTTPEEADLMAGNKDCDVTLVNTGIAVLTKKESLPVNVITSVSQIVLPSFEQMESVYTLKAY